MSRPRRRSRAGLLAGGALAATLALAACSSGGSSSPAASGTGTAAATSAAASATVSDSNALLSKAASGAVTGPSFGTVPTSQIVPWTASLMPTPVKPANKPISVDVIYQIPVGYAPYAAHLIQAVGAKLGWKVKVIPATASTAQASLAAMDEAVLDKPTAIISVVVPATWVGPALAKAKAEGIYTVDLHQDSTDGAGYDAYVPDGEGIQKELLAAYAVAKSNGTAKTLLFSAPGFSDSNLPAAQSFLSSCAGCSTQSVQINPTDFTDPVAVQSDVSAKLSANSGVNYIVWPDGGLPIQTVVTAISSSIASKSTQLIVNDAAPASVQLLKAGQVPIVVYAPAALTALIGMDDVNRLVEGQQPLDQAALRFPVSYWTTSNSPVATYPAITAAQLQQADWLTPFETAWNVQLKSLILGVSS